MRNAVGLLRLQAAIWALLCAGLIAGDAASLTGALARTPTKISMTAVVVIFVLALAAGTLAVAKFRLAYRLPRGSHQTREAVITVEVVMAGFAGLVLLALALTITGLIFSPPFIVGGVMSAWVASGLNKPPAQQYFDAKEAVDAQPAGLRQADGGRSAQFRGALAPV